VKRFHFASERLELQGQRLVEDTREATTGLGGAAVGPELGTTEPARPRIRWWRGSARVPEEHQIHNDKPKDSREVLAMLPEKLTK
jgi:hypothetical protein